MLREDLDSLVECFLGSDYQASVRDFRLVRVVGAAGAPHSSLAPLRLMSSCSAVGAVALVLGAFLFSICAMLS